MHGVAHCFKRGSGTGVRCPAGGGSQAWQQRKCWCTLEKSTSGFVDELAVAVAVARRAAAAVRGVVQHGVLPIAATATCCQRTAGGTTAPDQWVAARCSAQLVQGVDIRHVDAQARRPPVGMRSLLAQQTFGLNGARQGPGIGRRQTRCRRRALDFVARNAGEKKARSASHAARPWVCGDQRRRAELGKPGLASDPGRHPVLPMPARVSRSLKQRGKDLTHRNPALYAMKRSRACDDLVALAADASATNSGCVSSSALRRGVDAWGSSFVEGPAHRFKRSRAAVDSPVSSGDEADDQELQERHSLQFMTGDERPRSASAAQLAREHAAQEEEAAHRRDHQQLQRLRHPRRGHGAPPDAADGQAAAHGAYGDARDTRAPHLARPVLSARVQVHRPARQASGPALRHVRLHHAVHLAQASGASRAPRPSHLPCVAVAAARSHLGRRPAAAVALAHRNAAMTSQDSRRSLARLVPATIVAYSLFRKRRCSSPASIHYLLEHGNAPNQRSFLSKISVPS
ncbi:hypothetical protein ON010_g17047 [Phytophthora cinnamomi]|nr:hypothetical protein ON010_g17047 [Phytophthora cinnamomi]